jgi:hypothetical protein
MIYLPSLIKIDIDLPAILEFPLRNLRDCNTGITDDGDI